MRIKNLNLIKKLLLCLWIFASTQTQAQRQLTLKQVIDIAKGESPSALVAKNTKNNRYWQYRTFQSNYKPQLVLRGTLPNFNRAINPITLPDGQVAFINQSFAQNNLTLGLRQVISATGGAIWVNTGLQRLDILGDNRSTSFLATPAFISFEQPLFVFNELLWDKKIEPLRYEESQKKYSEDIEVLSVRATGLFFDLLLSQITMDLAKKNLANNDTIYRIAQGRYEMGRIAENELLQLELGVMNASQQLSQAQLDFQNNLLSLKNFLGNRANLGDFTLVAPEEIPTFEIDEQVALEQAKANRERYISFKRRILESERQVAQARGDNGIDINITGSIGFTNRAASFGEAYANVQNQQIFNIGLQIPILDWGRQKARIQTALANEEVTKSIVSQDVLAFEQEVLQKVRQFKILREQLQVSKRSDEVAQKSYDIAQNRYLIAKITINELINILKAKDDAKRQYLTSLRSFWSAYYELRQLTLYDFEKKETIYYQN
ncbi:TolC family protein [Thermoflexibacter ruber]|uniref:Outer membrane protein TolC n=1 Tax=Thermoflexibacter ruber TaxID=1003 RepID=A0A1I2B1Z2_9BACT|nr:TolC family protein [Thermoflexibacter ruber]SFE49928.1 Outer membrane protein TolC [Thermoflexibacter ruber]